MLEKASDFFLTFLQIEHKFFCLSAYLLFCMGNYADVPVQASVGVFHQPYAHAFSLSDMLTLLLICTGNFVNSGF